MRRTAAALAALSLALAPACARESQVAVFHVPGTRGEISVERRPSDPPRNEYRRTLHLRIAGRPAAHAEMFRDPGGYGRTNLYHLGGHVYRLRDADASYTADVDRHTLARDPARRAGGRFVGSFDVDKSGRWRFIPVTDRPEIPAEFRGG